MSNFKYPFIRGYMTFRCRGENIEGFLNECLKKEIKLFLIEAQASDTYKIIIAKKDLLAFKELGKQRKIETEALEKRGLPFFLKFILEKKEVLISAALSIFLLVSLSNILWKIEIEGLPEELEHRVYEQVKSYGIKEGNFIFKLPQASMIQQQLIKDIPDLLWIGVEKKGTSILLKGVEKLSILKEDPLEARDLVANKAAIVKDMFVIKGVAAVKRNDFVKENDLLISGKIQNEENEAEEASFVAAEGDVIGETWYEVNVTVALEGSREKLTGKHYKKSYLQLFDLHLPIHFKNKKRFKQILIEEEQTPIRFLFWETPFHFKQRFFYEVLEEEFTLNNEEAIKKGKKAAVESLKREIGHNFHVKTNKVLQETEENGKVNLILFVAIEENIVKSRPINQGD